MASPAPIEAPVQRAGWLAHCAPSPEVVALTSPVELSVAPLEYRAALVPAKSGTGKGHGPGREQDLSRPASRNLNLLLGGGIPRRQDR